MRVIVIDSAKREVRMVEISTNYKDIYPLLGESVDMFACPVQFNESDTLFVDDEGLYHPFEGGYMMDDWAYPILGNGVIIGSTDEGESTDVQMSVEDVQKMVRWVDKANCEMWRNHVLGGSGWAVYAV